MYLSNDQKTLILQAMGEVSMCWEHIERAGVFDSSKAVSISDGLVAALEGEIAIPKCQSRYQDIWGHVWECDNTWGHGMPSKTDSIFHSASIPAGWLPNHYSQQMHWNTSQSIR